MKIQLCYWWKIIFFCAFASFFSCQKKQVRNASYDIKTLNIHKADPKETYLKIKNLSPEAIDTTYNNLLSGMMDSAQFDLLHQHALYYKQLAGKRIYALALIARSEAWAYNYFAKYDSSNIFFREAIPLYVELHDPENLAQCYYGKERNYLFEGAFDSALGNDFKALAIYEQIGDSNNIYYIKENTAILYGQQKEYAKALDTLQACLEYYHQHANELFESRAASLLSITYSDNGEYQKALNYGLLSLSMRRKLGLRFTLSESLNNVAANYIKLKQWENAISSLDEALSIAREQNEEKGIPFIKENIALCIWNMGQRNKAEEILLQTLDSASQKKEEPIITNGYKLLYNFNKESGNYKAALQYYEQYMQHKDSLFNAEKNRTINELTIQYETGKKDAQIIRLNSERKADATQKLMYKTVIAFTVISAILSILFFINLNKKNKLVIEKVKLELEANERELHYFTESIINKNKVIEELELKLQEKAVVEATTENNEHLSQLYHLKILTEDDWRQFKILFDKVYPGFINRIRKHYLDLTPAEERQCLLIKLKINNRESANMLGISLLSIKQNRYRLKKRFNLSESEDLDEFVWNFESKIV